MSCMRQSVLIHNMVFLIFLVNSLPCPLSLSFFFFLAIRERLRRQGRGSSSRSTSNNKNDNNNMTSIKAGRSIMVDSSRLDRGGHRRTPLDLSQRRKLEHILRTLPGSAGSTSIDARQVTELALVLHSFGFSWKMTRTKLL